MKIALNSVITVIFLVNTLCLNVTWADSAGIVLPPPGKMLGVSNAFMPVMLKGVMVDPKDPFKFNFIVDSGDTGFTAEQLNNQGMKLATYFLAALTVPEEDMWVNLSPYEKDKTIAKSFGATAMGRDVLAQDYILKQLSASLTYPEGNLGKKFWERVYAKAQEKYGAVNLSLDTFNKVWIMPAQAEVYERNNGAFVAGARLTVMLEQDYLAAVRHGVPQKLASNISTHVIKEIILPILEQEVNEGAHFAPLRQAYNVMILAAWYKIRLKESILGRLYVNQRKVIGIQLADAAANARIYDQYLQAFKKGVYNYIKETPNATGAVTPRKYFSGGVSMITSGLVSASLRVQPKSVPVAAGQFKGNLAMVSIVLKNQSPVKSDAAMIGPSDMIRALVQMVYSNYRAKGGSPEGFKQYLEGKDPRISYKVSKIMESLEIDIKNSIFAITSELVKIREENKELQPIYPSRSSIIHIGLLKLEMQKALVPFDIVQTVMMLADQIKDSENRVEIDELNRLITKFYSEGEGREKYMQAFRAYIDSLISGDEISDMYSRINDDSYHKHFVDFGPTDFLKRQILTWHMTYKIRELKTDQGGGSAVQFLKYLSSLGVDIEAEKERDREVYVGALLQPIQEYVKQKLSERAWKQHPAQPILRFGRIAYEELLTYIKRYWARDIRIRDLFLQFTKENVESSSDLVDIVGFYNRTRSYFMQVGVNHYNEHFDNFIDSLFTSSPATQHSSVKIDYAMAILQKSVATDYLWDKLANGDQVYLRDIDRASPEEKEGVKRLLRHLSSVQQSQISQQLDALPENKPMKIFSIHRAGVVIGAALIIPKSKRSWQYISVVKDEDLLLREILSTAVKSLEIYVTKFDPAMKTVEDLGGIDLNAQNLDLLIKRDREGNAIPFSAQSIEYMRIEGLSPVILKISAVPNLNDFLN